VEGGSTLANGLEIAKQGYQDIVRLIHQVLNSFVSAPQVFFPQINSECKECKAALECLGVQLIQHKQAESVVDF